MHQFSISPFITARRIMLAIAVVCAGLAHAAPGDLDTTFGSGFGLVRSTMFGSVTANQFGTGERSGDPAMALQPDGKYVVAASCKTGATYDLCVARFDTDGGVDTSFGVNGIVVTDMRGTDDYVAGVALQPDGKIVVAGTCAATTTSGTGTDFCVTRYGANGVIDTSFGSGGKVFTSLRDFDDTASSMALQVDGKIVVAGFCAGSTSASSAIETCMARYTSAGALDPSFSGDGKLPVVRPNNVATPVTIRKKANGVAIAADGKIVLVGSTILVGSLGGGSPDYQTDLQIIRLLPNGTPDATFSGDGFVSESPASGWLVGNAVTVQPDGRIVVVASQVGACSNGQNECMIARRYTEAGALDVTFGSSGRVTLDFSAIGPGSAGYAVAMQSDGKIMLAGHCYGTGGYRSFCFTRLRDDGTLDKNFATNGMGSARFDTGSGDYAVVGSAAVQPDGKIVLAGQCYSAFCMLRLEGGPFGARNCSLDLDGDGSVLATTDMLIGTRVALGITGGAVIGGINFPVGATRDQWGSNTSRDIRKFLLTQCGMVLR